MPMIEINLLPEEMRKKESVRVTLPDIPTLKIFALALLGVVVLQVFLTAFAFVQRFELYSVGSRVAVLKDENKEITRVKNETQVIQAKLGQIQSLTARPHYWTSLLSGLTSSMTKGVWLRGLSLTDMDRSAASARIKNLQVSDSSQDKVRLLRLEGSAIGKGQETVHIGKFLNSLKDSLILKPFFSQIELTNINQRKVSDYDVYDFEILCVFKEGTV